MRNSFSYQAYPGPYGAHHRSAGNAQPRVLLRSGLRHLRRGRLKVLKYARRLCVPSALRQGPQRDLQRHRPLMRYRRR